MTKISIGDILYDPKFDVIVQVTGIGQDMFNQHAIFYTTGKQEQFTTAYFVFKYFIKLGEL